MKKFKNIGLDENIINAIKEIGFEIPMPIQEKVIPYLLKEDCQDLIALAQTGTGKTAAYGLPLIQRTDDNLNEIQHLILSPTRELCLQIADDLTDFAKFSKAVKLCAVFGGSSIENQIKTLNKGVQIVVATPGRLVDLINRKKINLSNIKTIVLDEADEMLGMGFRDELERILEETPKSRNTFLFSATMNNEVLKISKRYMNKPVEISVSDKNIGAENIHHICYTVSVKDRYQALKRIVDFNPGIYGIVFCRTRRETQDIADKLVKDGYSAEPIHGDLSQSQRETVMNKFRVKHLQLLIATDVAARGLDVDDLTHIINYNIPDEVETYTHRSGRTGRAGKSGTSILITTPSDKRKISLIERKIGKKFEFLPVPSGKDICEKQVFHLIDRMEKVVVDNKQIESFLPKIYEKLAWLDREELVKKFVSLEFNRFLDYYKNSKDLSAKVDKTSRSSKNFSDTGFTRFFLNLGQRDRLQPQTVIGLIKDNSGIRDISIGAIEILDNFSFFETDSNYDKEILNGFKGKSFNNRDIVVEVSTPKKSGGSRARKSNGKKVKKSFARRSEFGRSRSSSNRTKKVKRRY